MYFLAFIIAWYALWAVLRTLWLHWEAGLLRGERDGYAFYSRRAAMIHGALRNHAVAPVVLLAVSHIRTMFGLQSDLIAWQDALILIGTFLLLETVYTLSGIRALRAQLEDLFGDLGERGRKYLLLFRTRGLLIRNLIILGVMLAILARGTFGLAGWMVFLVLVLAAGILHATIATKTPMKLADDEPLATELVSLLRQISRSDYEIKATGYSMEVPPGSTPSVLELRDVLWQWDGNWYMGKGFQHTAPLLSVLHPKTASACVALRFMADPPDLVERDWGEKSKRNQISSPAEEIQWRASKGGSIKFACSVGVGLLQAALVAAADATIAGMDLGWAVTVLFGAAGAYVPYLARPLFLPDKRRAYMVAFECWRNTAPSEDRTLTDFAEQFARTQYLICHRSDVAVELAKADKTLTRLIETETGNSAEHLWNEVATRLRRNERNLFRIPLAQPAAARPNQLAGPFLKA